MQGGKLRRIKKATRAFEIEGDEVSSLGVSIGQRPVLMRRAKSTVQHIETAGWLLLIEARPCGGIDHQTRLISVLRLSTTGRHFQRLNDVHRYLGREYFALLVGNRLTVEH